MKVATTPSSKHGSFTGEAAGAGLESQGMSTVVKGSIILGATTVITSAIAGVLYWRRNRKSA